MAISGRQLRFRRWLSHDSVGSCEIATAPLGPRNDKFGSITRSTRVHTNLQLPMALTTRKGHAASVRRQSRQRLRRERRYIFLSRSRRYRRNRSVRFYRHLERTGSAFPRLPRRFAPRNDTSGRRSNGNGAAHRIGGTTAASRTGGACPSRRRTGVRDRLSLKWQTPKVCHCEEAKGRRGNLAVPGCIVGKLPAKSQLPSRDCHVASLLAMTRQAGTVVHQRPPAV